MSSSLASDDLENRARQRWRVQNLSGTIRLILGTARASRAEFRALAEHTRARSRDSVYRQLFDFSARRSHQSEHARVRVLSMSNWIVLA